MIKKIYDKNNNCLILRNTELTIGIEIQLKGKKRRSIGVIDKNGRVLYVKRNRNKHLFLKDKSYGFNYKLISEAKRFDRVELTDQHDKWVIPNEFIINNGKIKHFKNSSIGEFELQTFVTLESIESFKVKNFSF